MNYLLEILKKQKAGEAVGIGSACTANSLAIKAVLKRAAERGCYALVEATANQVDQSGGYTGMTPDSYRDFVMGLCDEVGFDHEKLLLGGDHLGPLTKSDCDEEEAMAYALELVKCYAAAGYQKIHIDTSMRLASDPQDEALSDETIASRGAVLCKACEEICRKKREKDPSFSLPVYVIGSEVPIPGGEQEETDSISVTGVSAVKKTWDVYQEVFKREGLEDALSRVIAIVVQPGVEFGNDRVFFYRPEEAAELVDFAKQNLPVMFEGHSTDYQKKGDLRNMVKDGIAILKVGPALTFALREALFSLELIEKEALFGTTGAASNFSDILELVMLDGPSSWKKHYAGDSRELRLQRKYSYSDRARYFLPDRRINDSVELLFKNIDEGEIPETLFSQYMPTVYRALREKDIPLTAENAVLEYVGQYWDDYMYAAGEIR